MTVVNTGLTARFRTYKQQAETLNRTGWEKYHAGQEAAADRMWAAESEYRSDMLRLLKLMNFDELDSLNQDAPWDESHI
jgi:hypothetical protein